jgi:uncharacterized protein HemX
MRRSSRHRRRRLPATGLLLLATLLPGLAACGEDAEDAEIAARRTALEQQRRQLQDQFAAAQNQVRNTQTRALDDPSIQPLRENFYTLLREKMIEMEPRAETWLDSAQTLGSLIDELSEPLILEQGQEPPEDNRKEVIREFRQLEQTLRPVQNRAMQDPEVAAAFAAMQDSVHALMIRMNPDAAGAIQRMKRTSAAVDSLEAEIAALED